MLLFLTREAFWRRSIEERRWDEGEPVLYMFSEFRFCQNTRGDVTESAGEVWNGDESLLSADFLEGDIWFQLGELRLLSVGEISDRGRGWGRLGAFVGDAFGGVLPFVMRNGCTGSDDISIETGLVNPCNQVRLGRGHIGTQVDQHKGRCDSGEECND